MSNKISHSLGTSFPFQVVFFGYLTFLASLPMLYYAWPIGVVLLITGVLFGFTRTGIEIDISNKKHRDYTSFIGYKTGKWKSIKNYPHLAILRRRFTGRLEGRTGISMSTGTNYMYDIFLLSKNHRHRLLVQRLKDAQSASTSAKNLAQLLDVEMVTFDPEISAATRAKRYGNSKQ